MAKEKKTSARAKEKPNKSIRTKVERMALDLVIVALYMTGKTVSEIAQAIGYKKGARDNRVRNALKEAGVYKSKRKAPVGRV